MSNQHHVCWSVTFIWLCALLLCMALGCDDKSTSPKSTPEPDSLSLGFARGGWKIASRPGHVDTSTARGKLLWHNVVGGERTDHVWDREMKQGEGTTNTLRLVFRPASVGMNSVGSWGGIMKYNQREDLREIAFLEMRVRGTHGRLHFDFGLINEDVDGNYRMNDEDGITSPALRNHQLEAEEDLGLDGLADQNEPGYDPLTNPDPHGDNWYCQGKGKCPLPGDGCENNAGFSDPNNPLYYEYLNGTEGNRVDIASGGLPDGEQLTSFNFNTADAYFSYAVDLSDTTSDHSFYVAPTNQYGWKIFRIPLGGPLGRDTAYSSIPVVQPSWAHVTHIRVWFEADGEQTQPDTLEVAEWHLRKN